MGINGRLVRHVVTRIFGALVPSGVRRILERERLRRRHGFAHLATSPEYHISSDTVFGIGCRLSDGVYIAGSTVGDYTYIEIGCRISTATIGRFCSIAPYTFVGLAEHPTSGLVSTHPMFYQHAPPYGYDLVSDDTYEGISLTTIGNDVWIGAGACIKGGVSVGDGAVIGAGAVVTRDVEPYAIYGGVPARLIRHRFDPETIEFLLELKWWERDLPWLREHAGEAQDIERLRSVLGSKERPWPM